MFCIYYNRICTTIDGCSNNAEFNFSNNYYPVQVTDRILKY